MVIADRHRNWTPAQDKSSSDPVRRGGGRNRRFGHLRRSPDGCDWSDGRALTVWNEHEICHRRFKKIEATHLLFKGALRCLERCSKFRAA